MSVDKLQKYKNLEFGLVKRVTERFTGVCT